MKHMTPLKYCGEKFVTENSGVGCGGGLEGVRGLPIQSALCIYFLSYSLSIEPLSFKFILLKYTQNLEPFSLYFTNSKFKGTFVNPLVKVKSINFNG